MRLDKAPSRNFPDDDDFAPTRKYFKHNSGAMIASNSATTKDANTIQIPNDKQPNNSS